MGWVQKTPFVTIDAKVLENLYITVTAECTNVKRNFKRYENLRPKCNLSVIG